MKERDDRLRPETFGQGTYGWRCEVCNADDYGGALVHLPGCAEAWEVVCAVRRGMERDAALAAAEARAEKAEELLSDSSQNKAICEGIRRESDLWGKLDAALAHVEALERQRNAGFLLRADICCSNGCGCEEYDYCAADMWDDEIVRKAVDASAETCDGSATCQASAHILGCFCSPREAVDASPATCDQFRIPRSYMPNEYPNGVHRVLGKCQHGVDLDRAFCEHGCRV